MTQSPNLLIDHIAASQAQKEVTANTAFDALDQALCGLLVKTLTDADVTLTVTEALSAMYLRVTGALTAARVITVPVNRKPLMVENATSGGFAIGVKTPAGASVSINAGLRKLLYGDGTDMVLVAEANVNAPYDVGTSLSGQPAAGATLLRYPLPRPVRFQAGLPNSKAVLGTAPTATVSFSLKKNGTQFASMQFAASATTATFTAASDTDFALGDILTITAPNPADSTLSDLGLSLAGIRL
jgi:hypothetical protein